MLKEQTRIHPGENGFSRGPDSQRADTTANYEEIRSVEAMLNFENKPPPAELEYRALLNFENMQPYTLMKQLGVGNRKDAAPWWY